MWANPFLSLEPCLPPTLIPHGHTELPSYPPMPYPLCLPTLFFLILPLLLQLFNIYSFLKFCTFVPPLTLNELLLPCAPIFTCTFSILAIVTWVAMPWLPLCLTHPTVRPVKADNMSYLFFFFIVSSNLAQCLAHSRPSVSICWMNQQTNKGLATKVWTLPWNF